MVCCSRPHRWLVEAHSTAGFQETSLGQRSPGSSEARPYGAGPGPQKAPGPCPASYGPERSSLRRKTADERWGSFSSPRRIPVEVCLDNTDVVIDALAFRRI